MKIIFLDIDGVLNSSKTIRKAGPRDAGYPESHIDEAMVGRLNSIIDATGAFCVLSSSWRVLWPLKEMGELLRRKGFRGSLIDATGRNSTRGLEIRDWLLTANDYQQSNIRFIILDDDSDMEPNMDRLVRTDWDIGLQNEHVKRAIEMLNGGVV